ncbi:MAG TPA: glycoside hydrolase TIM-barrel-like domain-containing protein [Chloroflexia bacterium]|nr:glycoside hydrolase TIM-barrel-like domain-containing protein [Chloroflexia bacterium]
MGPLSRPPRAGQVWGFRVALVTAVVLNLVVLGLLATRPAPSVPVAQAPTPTVGAGPTLAPTAVASGPTLAPTAVAAGPTLPPALGTASPAPLDTPTPLAHVLHPEGKIRGVNIPVWGPDFSVANPSIAGAAALDANWVALVSHWYVASAVPYSGGGIFREEGAVDNGQRRTASDESLGQAIDTAHALGLKVLLKPHVDWRESPSWRGYIYFDDQQAPGGRADWWASYRAMIGDTVRLALDHGAEGICIGTEFWSINKEPGSAAEWTRIIQQIRALGYRGQLTYAANWGAFGADAEYNRPGLAGVWQQLDFVGVDAYYPISDARDPTLDALVAGWHQGPPPVQQDNVAELTKLHEQTGKSIVFTEIGYPAIDYGAKNPGGDDAGPENLALQSRAAQAVYQVWGDVPWWGGALWWQYGPVANTHSLQGRPILDQLRQLWAQQTATALR